MPRNRKMFPFPLLIIPIILIVGLIVMLLWNAILPQVIHVSAINYWQALGLLILCKILFGGFRGRPMNRRREMWRGREIQWREKWKNMSDEERTKFRDEWKRRCGRPMDKNEQ